MALKRAGVKGITYWGRQDGRCFVVFDDKAIDVLKTFYQGSNVTYPDNGRAVGRIDDSIAATLHLNKPGAIVLDDIGLQHIEERHGAQIRSLGFENASDFVASVLANVVAVYDVDGRGRKYDLVARHITPQGRVMIRLEFAKSGDYYSVATAGPVRQTQYKNKTPLWEGAHSTLLQSENPWAARRASQRGQSGVLQQNAAASMDLTVHAEPVNNGRNISQVLDETEALAEGNVRGSVTADSGSYIIDLFKSANMSTLLHEMGHIYFLEMERAVKQGYADTPSGQGKCMGE